MLDDSQGNVSRVITVRNVEPRHVANSDRQIWAVMLYPFDSFLGKIDPFGIVPSCP